MAEKNMIVAMIISFIFTGLGIAYAGDVQKGIIFFAIGIVLNVLGLWVHPLFSLISLIFWIFALYTTYQEVKAVNGA